ncbi:DUF3934 family protein [Paenibacillus agricola]|uniref:DUF3934 family protein n=1 Tax=Paenibacillus agricola TaxID=2716264 RepID=A0ABX0J6Z7_9BACL|nr:DUF3934 family protein [Paenibacillus agricola]NHN29565.1 DUF3934 family protein [Paenibacillus agricola]
MAKGKGGTGRGTDSKGWTRWKSSEKKKAAKKTFGKNLAASKGLETNNNNKPFSTAKTAAIVSTRAKSKDIT